MIDAATGKVVATIPLGGKPESGRYRCAAGRVYVNIEDKNSIAVIDVAKHAVVANWPIAPGEEAAGLAIDLKNHRLFIGASNKLMLMMDSTNGKIVAQVPIGRRRRRDVVRSRHRVRVLLVGRRHDDDRAGRVAGKLTVVQTLKTARGARTMALDPATHRIYLATAEFQPPPAGAAPGRGRATMVPNSMKILVFGLNGK